MTDGGLYIVGLRLPEALTLSVGALGLVSLPAGHCYYVGSARRALPHRIARHARRTKPLRWHIDYLTALCPATVAWVLGGEEVAECDLAAALSAVAPVVRGFGASDCRCPGHLFHTPHDLDAWIVGRWPSALRVPLEVLP